MCNVYIQFVDFRLVNTTAHCLCNGSQDPIKEQRAASLESCWTASLLPQAFLPVQYNELNEHLPQYDELPKRLLRSAFIGFCASAVSDTCSNSIRVVKTSKQASTEKTTYPQVVRVRLNPRTSQQKGTIADSISKCSYLSVLHDGRQTKRAAGCWGTETCLEQISMSASRLPRVHLAELTLADPLGQCPDLDNT